MLCANVAAESVDKTCCEFVLLLNEEYSALSASQNGVKYRLMTADGNGISALPLTRII
jgi:hypothetical protein